MADLKISQLPVATTPLAGTELVPIVQGGTTDQTTVEAILTGTVPSGTPNGVLFLNGARVVSSGTALSWNGTTLTTSALALAGNISAAAWTTSGIGLRTVARTLTDTSSSGTVPNAYSNVLDGTTIAASNSTTYTNYATLHLSAPVAGTNVTFTNPLALSLGGAQRTALGTLTASLPAWDGTATWNAAGVTFTGWRLNVTDTASAAASLLADLQVGGVSQFTVSKAGVVTGARFNPTSSSATGTGVYLPAANTLGLSTNGAEQFRVAHTASAVNYLQVTGSTGVQPTLSAQGSGTNVDIVLTPKGTGNVLAGTVTNTNTSKLVAGGTISESVSSVQYLVASQYDVGTAPNQIPLNQYLGSMAFQSASGVTTGLARFGVDTGQEGLRVVPVAASVNYWQAAGAVSASGVLLSAQGADANITAFLSSKGAGALTFATNNFAQIQFNVAHTASAVNYLQATGSSGTTPALSAQGTGANVSVALQPKGTGTVVVNTGNGLGYGTGVGGTVTQTTSRTQGVQIDKPTGQITLVSAAGSAAWQSFTVTNNTVAPTDVVIVNQDSGTDKYMIHVTAVGAGSFELTYATTGGTTTEQPVFGFAVIKGVTA